MNPAMHEIDMGGMSAAFFDCWKAAGLHLDRRVDGGIRSWLRAHPNPPFLEHLSFRLGNQLFFVRVVDVDGRVQGPGSLRGLLTLASEANGHACLMPMKKTLVGGWQTQAPGWGLLEARTGKPIDAAAMVTDERVEMTGWEVQSMAVQVVRDHLEQRGLPLMSWQSNPLVDPSLWFVGERGAPEWVVVRPARFPATRASRPANWPAIAEHCGNEGSTGHFASVALANPDQHGEETPLPLWRGHCIHVCFDGME